MISNCLIDLEKQKKHFENHVASFADLGDIKILDFKKPDSSEYRIRFLFEEDYYILHISGDLGELTAQNRTNMSWAGFKDFINNPGYFEEKVESHSRKFYVYDYDLAKEQLKNQIDESNLKNYICKEYLEEDPEYAVEEFIIDVLEDFENETGISPNGCRSGSKIISDFWEEAGTLGKQSTGIIDIYMLAFKMALNQLYRKGNNEHENG